MAILKTNRRNLFILQRCRGGVGQTTLATLVASRAAELGMPVNIIEKAGGYGELSARFRGVDGVKVTRVEMRRITQIFGEVEKAAEGSTPPSLTIIDTPNWLEDLLDQNHDVVAAVAEGLGMDLTVAYTVQCRPGGYPEKLGESGLMGLKRARRAVVYPSWSCSINDMVQRHPELNPMNFADGIMGFSLCALHRTILDRLQDTERPFHCPQSQDGGQLLSPEDLKVVNTWRFANQNGVDWLVGAYDIVRGNKAA